MVRVKLEDVCERGTSNLKMSDVTDLSGNYPIYGAAGYIGNVDFYHQINPYVAIVKDGAGIGRAMLCPAQSSIIGTNAIFIAEKEYSSSISLLRCKIYAFRKIFYRCNNTTYLF